MSMQFRESLIPNSETQYHFVGARDAVFASKVEMQPQLQTGVAEIISDDFRVCVR